MQNTMERQLMWLIYSLFLSLLVSTSDHKVTAEPSTTTLIKEKTFVCPAAPCSCPSPGEVVCRTTARLQQLLPYVPLETTVLELDGYTEIPIRFLAPLVHLRRLRIIHGSFHDAHFIPHLPNLEELDLSSNNITQLGDEYLGEIVPNLKSLLVSNNHIETLAPSALRGLKKLLHLQLQNNPLHTADRRLLSDLVSLQHLDLSNTRLSILHYYWMIDAHQLLVMNFSNANLKQVPKLTGKNFLVLDLSNNQLGSLPTNFLDQTPKMEELFLHHNPLQHIGAEQLKGPHLLKKLDLSYTNLMNLDEHVYIGCPLLKHLYLHHMSDLKRIEHGAFTGLHALEHLDLSYTPNLLEIEEVAFQGLNAIITLNLQHSGLNVLPSSTIMLPDTSKLLFSGSQIHCDCYHSWLPDMLLNNSSATLKGFDPVSCTNGQQLTRLQFINQIRDIGCQAPVSEMVGGEWQTVLNGDNALLDCNVTSHPPSRILWISNTHHIYENENQSASLPWVSRHIQQVLRIANKDPRIEVLESGQLLIRELRRSDIGRYKCFAYNSVGNTSIVSFLGMDNAGMRNLEVEGGLFGFACATVFLSVTLLVQAIYYLMDRCGLLFCCCKCLTPRAKKVRKLLECVESYKSQQLERLRENYTSQAAGIKDSCYQQMEKLRESYTGQCKHMKDFRDYGTQQLSTLRDQYLDQVNRVRDYSVQQMNRVHENYDTQRHRIRKFSAHQLFRLRETYKYQQKTLNKIMENLPDLYLQNCRTGGCQRTDSLIFDDEINGLDTYYRVDFFDSQSRNSDYYTPSSTLSRSSRAKGHERHLSRGSQESAGSGSSKEAQTTGLTLWSILPTIHHRSASIPFVPSQLTPKFIKAHKRSLSHPSPPSTYETDSMGQFKGNSSQPELTTSATPPRNSPKKTGSPNRDIAITLECIREVHSPLPTNTIPINCDTTDSIGNHNPLENSMENDELLSVAVSKLSGGSPVFETSM